MSSIERLTWARPKAAARLQHCRGHLVPVAVWTVLCVLFFGTILVGVDRLPSSDLTAQFYSFAQFQAREMARGRLPIWSPGSYAGTPFASDTQAAVYYPVRWLTILLTLPWGFPFLALEWEAVFHIWLAGLFTYALAYSITRRHIAALAGGVAFALGGYLTYYPMIQLAILETIAWLPLVLLLLRIAVASKRPIPWLVAAGLALSTSALAGHPQTFLHVAYAAAAYYLFAATRSRWHWRQILGLGALVAAVAVGCAASALLPAWRLLGYTVRRDASYDFAATGLPMLDYIQLFVPGVLSVGSPEYLGLAAALLVLLAIWARRHGDRAEIAFWTITALVVGWLALGDSGVLFELVYHIAPGFSLFQHQERLLGVFSLSCALLTAQGVALWLEAEWAVLRPTLLRLGWALGLVLPLIGLVLLAARPIASPSWPGVWLRQCLVGAAALLLLAGCSRRKQRAWLLVVLLGLDLYVSTLRPIERRRGSPWAYWPQPEWLQLIRTAEPTRLDSGGLFFGNLGEIHGVEDVRGISPLRPRALVALEELPRAKRWQLLNVSYVLARSQPGDVRLTKIADTEERLDPDRPFTASLYRFEDALPRARMCYRPVYVRDGDEALRLLKDPAFDVSSQVILQDWPGREELPQPSGEASAQVRTTRLGPGALEMRVVTEAPGYLVISEWHYPGWEATLDGRPAPIRRANYAFQAVYVPAGEHRVVTRYVPRLEAMAFAASLLSLAMALLVAWRWKPILTRGTAGVWHVIPPRAARGRLSVPRRWVPLLGALATLLGFALRAYRLGAPELRGDEAFSWVLARLPLAEIASALLRQGDPHSPLHYWLLHGAMGLLGDSEFAMRYLSLVPGVLLLPLLYRLGREISGPRVGVLLGALGAFSEPLVAMSQDLRNQHTLAMLFATAATLLLARAVVQRRAYLWVGYGLTCALTVYSHYYGVAALVAHTVCMLAIPRWRASVRVWALALLGTGGLFLPWLLVTWSSIRAAGLTNSPGRPELAAHLTVLGSHLAVGSAIPLRTARWLFVAALVPFAVGARTLVRDEPAWGLPLILWLGAAALIIYLMRFIHANYNPYYILLASTAWLALLAAGISALWLRGTWGYRAASVLAAACLVIPNGVSLARYYFDPACRRAAGYRLVAAHIEANARPGDVFVRNFPDPSFDYYLEDIPLPRAMQPAAMGEDAAQVEAALVDLTARYDRLWFVPTVGSHWDPQGTVLHWLEYHALLEERSLLDGQDLRAYRPLRTAAAAMEPLDLQAGSLRLKGAYVTVNGRPVMLGEGEILVPPGSTVQVTLLWECLADMEQSYTVFVHLLGEDNHLVTQHDGIPLFGTRPTQFWLPGEQLLDRHELTVPQQVPVSKGWLVVGVYDSQTIVRQRFADGRDAVSLAGVRFADR
jgi:hypothetical protein